MKGLRFVLLMMLWATFGRVSTLAQHSPLVNAFPRLSFFKPTFITHATDGSDRLFVVQQNGIIKVFLNDSSMSVASTFLDLSHKISSYSGEEGLLGLAFHPNFRQNGFFYVSYTRFKPGTHAMQVVISRFSVSPVDANRADSLSEYFLLTNDKPSDGGVVQSNHNGGMLSFGPDGFLYIGTGDGGSANDPWNNAQNLSVLLGKILRIDVDHGLPYAIPPDNPYAGNTNGWKGEIWAYGLRNPWRFSFDSLSGRLWAGDVGQDTREEIDLITKGGNYGWRVMEGSIFRPGGGKGDSTGLIMPLADYDHTQGEAVIGGYVYRGHRRPDLVGIYFYSDWISGRIWTLRYDSAHVIANSIFYASGLNISSLGTDAQGELYFASWGDGRILQFAKPGPGGPTPPHTRPPSHLAEFSPNPTTNLMQINFHLDVAGPAQLQVYDITGRRVLVLLDHFMDSGSYSTMIITAPLASGTYFLRLESPGISEVRKFVVVR
jgi:glucose/arabinose dehydrogenase